MLLDSMVFSKEHQIDREIMKKRLEVNDQADIGVFDGEDLMGYISLYPIPQSIYNEIKSGIFEESKVELHTLPSQRPGTYYAYLSGVAINKKLYPRFKGKFLIEQLEHHIRKLRKKGVFIKGIVAYAVSTAGRKTLERMRFKEIKLNVYVYDCFKQGVHFIKKRIINMSDLIRTLKPKLVDV